MEQLSLFKSDTEPLTILIFSGNGNLLPIEILDLLRPIGQLSIISQQKNILILNINDVKVDFVNYSYPIIGTPIIENPIRLLSLADIAAMKLSAIAGRGKKRDFYDLYFLLKEFSLEMMMGFYNQKYTDGSEMMVARSLTFFDDADTDETPRLLDQDISWEFIKNTILGKVRELY